MISSKKISIDQIDSSSLTPITAFNTFTSSYNTGSFTGSFTGSLEGTASFALSASYADVSASLGYLPLNEDFSSLPTASLPLSGSEELAITQDGETRKVAVSEFGGGGDDTFTVLFQGAYLTYTANTWRHNSQIDGFNIGGTQQTAGTGAVPTGGGWNSASVFMIPSGFILEKAWLYIRRVDNPSLPTNPQIFIQRVEPLGGFEYNATTLTNFETLVDQSMSFTATNGGYSLYVKDLTIASHTPKDLSGIRAGLRVTGNNMGVTPSLLLTFKKA